MMSFTYLSFSLYLPPIICGLDLLDVYDRSDYASSNSSVFFIFWTAWAYTLSLADGVTTLPGGKWFLRCAVVELSAGGLMDAGLE